MVFKLKCALLHHGSAHWMRSTLPIVLLFSLMPAQAEASSRNTIKYEVIDGLAIAQGDMVLGKIDTASSQRPPFQHRGLGQVEILDRWIDGIVPYDIDPALSANKRDRVMEAIAHWNEKTSILMVERTDEHSDYLVFQPHSSCLSYVGKQGGDQPLWVGDTCTAGNIIHEIGHAIGLFHEHTRSDRDNFITVQWANIVPEKKFNFEVIDAGTADIGVYDYGSIMHYGERFFSINSEPTIVAPDNQTIGQRVELSVRDARSVDEMYATDLAMGVTPRMVAEQIEIDMSISNIGVLGANSLLLTVLVASDSDWLSVSADSGWDCQAFGAELRCTRATMPNGGLSRFTLLVDPLSGELGDVRATLSSRTKDLDVTNNVFNTEPVIEVVSDSPSEPEPAPEPEPDVGAAQAEPPQTADQSTPPETGQARPSADASGGGTVGGAVLVGLLAGLFRRRQRA